MTGLEIGLGIILLSSIALNVSLIVLTNKWISRVDAAVSDAIAAYVGSTGGRP